MDNTRFCRLPRYLSYLGSFGDGAAGKVQFRYVDFAGPRLHLVKISPNATGIIDWNIIFALGAAGLVYFSLFRSGSLKATALLAGGLIYVVYLG